MSSSDQATLKEFYTATENINFVEKAKVLLSSIHISRLKLQITPVGETRLPSNVVELEVSKLYIILAILTALPILVCSVLSCLACRTKHTYWVP